MDLFDTHTHLNVEAFETDIASVIQRAKAAGVTYMTLVGFDRPTIERALELSQMNEGIIAAIGWHPTEAGTYSPEVETWLIEQLAHPKVHMLGEIGLDYYWDTAPRDIQARVFKRQIAIAKELNLPITIHNREATEDVYRILSEEGIPQAGGIMHSFGGTVEQAQAFLDLGMYLSFSGVLTFKKAQEVREAALVVPDNRLLIETDAPYLSPVPYRGKRNEPAYVIEVAKCLADLKGYSLEQVSQITTQNAFNLFNWYPKGREQTW